VSSSLCLHQKPPHAHSGAKALQHRNLKVQQFSSTNLNQMEFNQTRTALLVMKAEKAESLLLAQFFVSAQPI